MEGRKKLIINRKIGCLKMKAFFSKNRKLSKENVSDRNTTSI